MPKRLAFHNFPNYEGNRPDLVLRAISTYLYYLIHELYNSTHKSLPSFLLLHIDYTNMYVDHN